MKSSACAAAFLTCLMPCNANAMQIELPSNAVLATETDSQTASAIIATSPFYNGQLDTVAADGEVYASAWQLPNSNVSTLQLISPMREQLIKDGFEIVLDCDAQTCGGFDFRYAIELLPEPEMHVNLGDFRYLSAQRETRSQSVEYFSIMVSKSARTGFIHITHVEPSETQDPKAITSTKSIDLDALQTTDDTGLSVTEQLDRTGHSALDDLVFQTGSSNLGQGDFNSLSQLADYLKSNPSTRVALVGHTDAEGSLANNLSLSKQRANSVVRRLISNHGVPASQLEAAGVGYLAPRAKNDSAEGREQNRRVEVVVTSIAVEEPG